MKVFHHIKYFLVVFIFCVEMLSAQSVFIPKKGLVEGGLNISFSSINLYRNDFTKPHMGYGSRIIYHFKESFGLMGEFYHNPAFDATPTWKNIKSNNGGVNFLIYGDIIDEETEMYILMGANYHHLSGYFTGHGDSYGLSNFFEPGNTVNENRLGLNMGFGLQRAIDRVTFFCDFRYRFSSTDLGSGINDVGYYFGLNYAMCKIYKRTKGIYKNVINKND